MKKTCVFMMIWLGMAVGSYAQDMALNRMDGRSKSAPAVSRVAPKNSAAPDFRYMVYGEIPVAETSFMEEHFLGAEVTSRWNTFLKNYTHEYEVEVGFSGSGVELVKPSIYNAVERANKYVKKQLKKKLLSREEAVRIMSHVLDCANVICFESDTEKIEKAAREAKSGEDVLRLFGRVELVKM